MCPPATHSLQEETTLEASGQQYLACMSRVAAVFGRLQAAIALLAKQGNWLSVGWCGEGRLGGCVTRQSGLWVLSVYCTGSQGSRADHDQVVRLQSMSHNQSIK